jgi:hypothetical protein
MSVAASAIEDVGPSEESSADVPSIVAASVIGEAHVRAGLPCQDAFRAFVSDSAVVLAVADGLGSAERSDLGAMTATIASSARALEFSHGDPVRAAMEGVVAAREALEALSGAEDCALADLACTLIVAVVHVSKARIGIAHIGDGCAIGLRDEEPYVLSPPAASEYVNEVKPLTADDWVDHVRPVAGLDGVDAIALFTDGVQHAALRRDEGILRAHAGFFRPLFSFARSGVASEEASVELADLLGGPKMGEHSDDDKTLVLVTLR